MNNSIRCLEATKVSSPFIHKRDCYDNLMSFLEDKSSLKICALYGLRRTGKSVLMYQAIENLRSNGIDSRYYTCRPNASMFDLEKLLDEALKDGIKHVFIDEITNLSNFQEYAAILSDYYALQGMKIVISGTDSLGISLAGMDQLFDRIQYIHTSYVPFGEFHRLVGGDVGQYISYGGTLTNSAYKDHQATEEYYNSAIVGNILHSLEKSEGLRQYPPALTELYDNDELKSTINKMIGLMNQYVVLKAVLRDYKNAPLMATVKNLRPKVRYNELIHINEVTNYTKQILEIKNSSEMETKLSDAHLYALKKYLIKLDLLLLVPVYSSLKERRREKDLEIILQPGMVYNHATALLQKLADDSSWSAACQIEDKNLFLKRADHFVKGIILENAIIANAYINFGQANDQNSHFYVSKLSVEGHELDMILCDLEQNTAYLFEIKYAETTSPEQTKHLTNETFQKYITENFGTIAGKYLVYNGPSHYDNGINFINAKSFLQNIYQSKDNCIGALNAINAECLRAKLHVEDRILFSENKVEAKKDDYTHVKEDPCL